MPVAVKQSAKYSSRPANPVTITTTHPGSVSYEPPPIGDHEGRIADASSRIASLVGEARTVVNEAESHLDRLLGPVDGAGCEGCSLAPSGQVGKLHEWIDMLSGVVSDLRAQVNRMSAL